MWCVICAYVLVLAYMSITCPPGKQALHSLSCKLPIGKILFNQFATHKGTKYELALYVKFHIMYLSFVHKTIIRKNKDCCVFM